MVKIVRYRHGRTFRGKALKNTNKKLLKECVVVAYIINVHTLLCRLKVSLDLVL